MAPHYCCSPDLVPFLRTLSLSRVEENLLRKQASCVATEIGHLIPEAEELPARINAQLI